MAKRIQRTEKRQTTRIQRMNDNKPTRYYSKKQESYIADRFNGSRQKNSGATMFEKGDVSLENVIVEAKTKTTSSQSISIKKEWIEKNEQEALFMGKKYGVIAFNFGPNESNHYIINEELFDILLQHI